MKPESRTPLAWLRTMKRAVKPSYASPMEVEANEWSFYLSYLREGMVVFDVGAFIGELTLLFSRFVQASGQVHAFEATLASFRRLEANCRAFQRSNVVLNHCAVCDETGTTNINVYDTEHLSWSSLANRPLDKYGIDIKPPTAQSVPCATIDGYCAVRAIDCIDLLKIDVEGAEYQVLRGAAGMLAAQRIRCCTFEFGQTTFDMGNQPTEIQDYLRSKGYQVRNIVPEDPVFPGRQRPGKASFSMHVATPIKP
jgi:FkbM family methyltransferase